MYLPIVPGTGTRTKEGLGTEPYRTYRGSLNRCWVKELILLFSKKNLAVNIVKYRTGTVGTGTEQDLVWCKTFLLCIWRSCSCIPAPMNDYQGK